MAVMTKNTFFSRIGRVLPYIISAIISLVYFLAILQYYPAVYAINDDRAMYRIISGEMTGKPDGHAIFILYPLSFLMSKLFEVIPVIDWYALMMIGSMCFALSLLLYRTLSLKRSARYWGTAGILLVFHVMMQEHIASFQFTVVASVLGAVTVFWILTMDDEKYSFVEILVGVLLIFLTVCIRDSVFFMCSPFIFLAYIYKNVRITGHKVEVKRVLAVVLSAVVVCGSMALHEVAYSSKEWKEFLEYNGTRSKIYDYYGYPDYNEYQQFYEECGVSREEYDCLVSYNLIMDYRGDQLEKLKRIAEKGEEIYRKNINEKIVLSIENTIIMLQDRGMIVYHILKTGIIFMIGILYWGLKQRKAVGLWLVGFVTYLVEYTYLLLKGRLILRVAIAMDIVFIFFSIAIIALFLYRFGKNAKVGIYMSLLMALIFSCINIPVLKDKLLGIEYGNEVLTVITGYCREREENFYFSFGETLNTTRDIHVVRDEGCWNYTGFGGWLANSPIEKKRLQRGGIQNVDEALLTMDNVFIIAPDIEMTEKERALREYLDSKYSNVQWEKVDLIDLYTVDYIVWKVTGNM